MKNFIAFTLLFSSVSIVSGQTFDSYINSPQNNVYEEIAGPADKLFRPNDLDFNLHQTNGTSELWVINEAFVSSGGTTVTIFNPGKSNQSSVFKKDGNSWHFMSLPTSLAFGDHGHWASGVGVFDANHNNTPFTGPSLWASDTVVYAVTLPGRNGSHLDMLHQSPYSMGIAHDVDNVYWVADGYNQAIVRYDFAQDHGPGNSWHDDGKVHFYYDVPIKRDIAGLPGHIVLDKKTDWLYICDAGNQRILRMNTASGNKKQDLPFNMEPLAERWEMENTAYEVITTNVSKPCGIDVYQDRLIVTDNGTSEIIIYDISTNNISEVGRIAVPHDNPDIRGVKVDHSGHIWFVDYFNSKVFRLKNDGVVGQKELVKNSSISIYPNPATDVLNIQNQNGLALSNIRIMTLEGRQAFYTENIQNNVNVSDLNRGLYFIYLQDEAGEIYVQKFYKN